MKGDVANENCPVCTEGKRKTSSFKRNEEYREMVTKNFEPYWRMYADGYGGQRSMGEESYQGAVGGFVFACPASGTIKVNGKVVKIREPHQAIEAGIGLLTEDRKKTGIMGVLSVRDNMSMAAINRFSFMGVLRKPMIDRECEEQRTALAL